MKTLKGEETAKELGIEVQRKELNFTVLKTELLLLSINVPLTMPPG